MIGRQVKKYLCIPATSTASERVFSAGGNVVTCQLSFLKSATVNSLSDQKSQGVNHVLLLKKVHRYSCQPRSPHSCTTEYFSVYIFIEIIFVFFVCFLIYHVVICTIL